MIVNYNSGRLLAETVAGLERQTDADFEAVIVDNASNDGSIETLVLPDSRFSLMRVGANLGFAVACNRGARGARTPWLAMLNPDAIPMPDWLANLRQAVARYPDTVLFGSTQLNAEDPRFVDGGGDNFSIYGLAWRGGHGFAVDVIGADRRVFSPCGAAALYRQDIFEAVGGFAESFFCYLEDVDLGFRLNLQGYEAIQVANARVYHFGSACSGGKTSSFALHYGVRNALFVAVRCMPFPLVFLTVPLFLLSQIWIGLRAGQFVLRMRSVWSGLKSLPSLVRQRRALQSGQVLSAWQTARLLVWDPRLVSRLSIVSLPRVRSVPPKPAGGPTGIADGLRKKGAGAFLDTV